MQLRDLKESMSCLCMICPSSTASSPTSLRVAKGTRHLYCEQRCRFLREQRLATAINRKGQKRLLERSNNVLKGHVLSLKYRLLAVLRHLDCGRRLWSLREQRLVTAIDRKGQTRMALCCGTVSLWLLSIVLPATQFESPVCEGGLWEADSKIEGWDQSKQTKEGVPKRALRARSTVSTLLLLRWRRVSLGRLQQRYLIDAAEGP